MDTRQALLQALLTHKEAGLSIDELGERLGVTRSAVQQHLARLERDGLVESRGLRASGGRPSRGYGLSERGYESFPRNYDLLAQAMLEAAHDTLGEAGLEALLARMADDLAAELRPRLEALPPPARLAEVVRVMNELGYQAAAAGEGVAAVNCVYHKLARQTRAVCRYDVRLLSGLLGQPLELHDCMAEGENRCLFKLR